MHINAPVRRKRYMAAIEHIIYGIVLYKFVEKSGVNVVPLFVYKEMCSGDVGMVESNWNTGCLFFWVISISICFFLVQLCSFSAFSYYTTTSIIS